ncbi:hypothetical protein COB64_04450 [Candidatus Wolfebacteria bacterium]|nr:MAG: hypothetical protein COB64_04450 [Candidatus Wolfebacteria bacterium]
MPISYVNTLKPEWDTSLNKHKEGTVKCDEVYELFEFHKKSYFEYTRDRRDPKPSIRILSGKAVMKKTSPANKKSAVKRVYDVDILLPLRIKTIKPGFFRGKTVKLQDHNGYTLVLVPHKTK